MPKSDKLKISKSEQDKKGDSFTKWISQNWLSLANLLLVGLVGIGVAIYLNVRSEEFQKQLQLPKISISAQPTAVSQTALFLIENEGLVTATNIRLAICLIDVTTNWQNDIKDIEQFDFTVSNPSLHYAKDNTTTKCPIKYGDISSNSVTLLIDRLPPNEPFLVSTNIRQNIPIQTQYIVSKVFANVSGKSVFGKSGNNLELGLDWVFPLYNVLNSLQFKIASFGLFASCDCTLASDKDYGSLYTAVVDYTSLINMDANNLALISETNNYTKVHFDLDLSYITPQNKNISLNDPIYLEGNYDAHHNPVFTQIDKAAFDAK